MLFVIFFMSPTKKTQPHLNLKHTLNLIFLSRFLRVFKEERNLLIKEEKREKGWLVTF
jgi:hypothetical protein